MTVRLWTGRNFYWCNCNWRWPKNLCTWNMYIRRFRKKHCNENFSTTKSLYGRIPLLLLWTAVEEWLHIVRLDRIVARSRVHRFLFGKWTCHVFPSNRFFHTWFGFCRCFGYRASVRDCFGSMYNWFGCWISIRFSERDFLCGAYIRCLCIPW